MAIYIALGANLSNGEDSPAHTFIAALAALSEQGVMIEAVSSLWQSPAWPPGNDQPDYINATAKVTCDLSAVDLLALLHRVEAQMGRARSVKNAARTLDLDLLDYKGQITNSAKITLPHPRMLSREFVLFPLSEIASDWTDPKKKRAIQDWIARLPLSSVAPLQRVGKLTFT